MVGQWKEDSCPDFKIRYRKVRVQKSYYGSAQHSIRHTQWGSAVDVGMSAAINNGGPSYSRLNLNVGLKQRITNNIQLHQDWVVQLHDNTWDTLFHTNNIEPIVSYAGLSIGYEWYSDRPVLGYTYMGFGTGGGNTFSNPDYSLNWVSKARGAINHEMYWTFQSFWDLNEFFNLYDDNIMWGLSIGWYLDQNSKYKK